MRSNVSAVEDAWTLVVAGAEQRAVIMLTGVAAVSVKRMRAALRKLTKHAPECAPARMTWKDAAQAAAALSPQRLQARKIADTLRKALGSEPLPVCVFAEALAMTNAALPGALMNTWATLAPPATTNVTRGVRHHETKARN